MTRTEEEEDRGGIGHSSSLISDPIFTMKRVTDKKVILSFFFNVVSHPLHVFFANICSDNIYSAVT